MSAAMSWRTFLASALVVIALLMHTAARAACMNASAPATGGAKLILVDNTTVIAPEAAAQLVARLVEWPTGGERVVIASFGGMRGDLLRVHFDERLEPLALPPSVVNNMPMREYKAYVACAKAADARIRAALTDVLGRELARREPAASGNTSPVIDALLAATTIFEDVRAGGGLVAISDGIVHEAGAGATTFYAMGAQDRVKELDVGALLAVLQRQHRLPHLRNVRVWHAGLGATGSDGKGARSPAELAALREFWSRFWELAGADFRGAGYPVPVRPFN